MAALGSAAEPPGNRPVPALPMPTSPLNLGTRAGLPVNLGTATFYEEYQAEGGFEPLTIGQLWPRSTGLLGPEGPAGPSGAPGTPGATGPQGESGTGGVTVYAEEEDLPTPGDPGALAYLTSAPDPSQPYYAWTEPAGWMPFAPDNQRTMTWGAEGDTLQFFTFGASNIWLPAGTTYSTTNDGTDLHVDLSGATLGLVKVTHGADPNVARPDAPLVYWVGTVTPVNADPDDLMLLKG